MAAVVLADLRARGIVGKTVAQPIAPFLRFGHQLAQYEEHRRRDPVPAPWEEYTGRGPPLETGEGPCFTPQVGWATLDMPGYPAAGAVRLGALGFSYDPESVKGKAPAMGMHVLGLMVQRTSWAQPRSALRVASHRVSCRTLSSEVPQASNPTPSLLSTRWSISES